MSSHHHLPAGCSRISISVAGGGGPLLAPLAKVFRTGRQAVIVLYVLALVAVVVGADVMIFRYQFWPRLMANIGIVLVFAAFYLRFLKHS